MRTRALVAVAVLLLPSVAEAQIRLPRIGSRGVPKSTPLGPQPVVVSRALAYNRLRASFESYPLIAFYNTGSFAGNGVSEWASTGLGSRVDYRVMRLLSLTFDMTSTFLGGPVYSQSAELGFRFGPRRSERSVYPFVDARYGYFLTLNGGNGGDAFGVIPGPGTGNFVQSSQGFGTVVGGGLEYTLTRRFSIASSVSVAKSDMTAQMTQPQVGAKYQLTTWRYIAALRYNGVRYNPVP